MRSWKHLLALAVLAAITVINVHPAAAQLVERTWVSRNGDNANICSSEFPCLTLSTALSKTLDGGAEGGIYGIHFELGNSLVVDNVRIGNQGTGIFMNVGASVSELVIRNATIVGNGSGTTGAGIRIGRSTVTKNGIGLSTFNAGQIHSYGTNQINHNTNDGIMPNPIPMK